MAPAPSPYGKANNTSIKKLLEIENPNKAIAVNKIETPVIMLVLNFRFNLSENKLEIIVQPEMIIVTMPIYEISTENSLCITGHADPSKESGRPRLMNAKYIIASNNENI